MREFDNRDLRNALGHLAVGVAVVSAFGAEGERVGLTVSSFNSVSLSPPLVLFSIAETATSLPALRSADAYAVNLLTTEQSAMSSRFARSRGAKWNGLAEDQGRCIRCPILRGALAVFECVPFTTYAAGDHVIFLGEVVYFETNRRRDPLVFFRGGYHSLVAAEELAEAG